MLVAMRTSHNNARGQCRDSTIPLINNLEIGNIFKDKDKEEGDSVTDLVLLVLRILR